MSETPDPFLEVERQMHINQLKNEVRDITGVTPETSEAADAPSEVIEDFWEHILQYEKAPYTTLGAKWSEDHGPLAEAAQLDDAELKAQLWRIINWLGTRQTFLYHTDHLSDRELYAFLLAEVLPGEIKDVPVHPDAHLHWDVIGSGSDEDTDMNFRFYADDREIADWAELVPDYVFPKREIPLYDRDQYLPQVDYSDPRQREEDLEDEDAN